MLGDVVLGLFVGGVCVWWILLSVLGKDYSGAVFAWFGGVLPISVINYCVDGCLFFVGLPF